MTSKTDNDELYELIDRLCNAGEMAEFKTHILHCIDGTPLFIRRQRAFENKLMARFISFALKLSVSGDNNDRFAMQNTPDGAIITLRPSSLSNFNELAKVFSHDSVSSITLHSLTSSDYGYTLINGSKTDAHKFMPKGHSLSLSKTRGRDDFYFDLEVFESHSKGTAMEGRVSIGDIPLALREITPETNDNKSLIDVSSLAINTLVWGRDEDITHVQELMGDGFTSSHDNRAHLVTAIEHYFERHREPDVTRIAALMSEADLTLDDVHIERSVDELTAALNQILLSDSNKKLKINKLKL